MTMSVPRWWVLGATLVGSACLSGEPQLVGSNCDKANGCIEQSVHLDAVDILMVIDDSSSIVSKAAALKAELPRMLNAIVTGSDGPTSFPPASSVHVAVTTTDMGVGDVSRRIPSCTEKGGDGVFVRPGEVGVTCDVSYPGYLAYDGGAAPIATSNTVSCVPLVFAEPPSDTTIGSQTPSTDAMGSPVPDPRGSHGSTGCGIEQPLEAALKSVWPSANSEVTFLSGNGHGTAENSGFLRDNSLLVVVVVTDEDDCSTQDPRIFAPASEGAYADQPINLRCFYNKDKLQDPQRYIDHFKRLRPGNDNVVVAIIGGVPPELVADEFRAKYDFSVKARADAYFADVLSANDMQEVVDSNNEAGSLTASCTTHSDDSIHVAFPPRRLVEVARGFGSRGVLGSVCTNDFGSTTGHIIRAVGERLTTANR